MKKKFLFALLVVIVATITFSVISWAGRSRSRNALADYKAKLRNHGEKLTFAELGLPGPPESNANLAEFVLLADRVATKSSLPGVIELQRSESPGVRPSLWRGGNLRVVGSSAGSSNYLDWALLSADMKSSAELLAKLRMELEHPPRHFDWNYTNPFATSSPKNPFVEKRKVAQFLTADSFVALHEHQLLRAQINLHALTQLVQVHRDDWTLVSAMIRVAISGIALECTWQALQAEGWDDESLARLQRDWEELDLIAGLENGFTGERAFGQQAFAKLRIADAEGQDALVSTFRMASFGGSPSSTGFKRVMEDVSQRAALMYWRGHMDEDEMLYLGDSQSRIETVRRLRTNVSAASLKLEFKAQQAALEKAFDRPFGKLRHLFSAIAIPNFSRAFEVAVQRETEKRMAVTAIALKRYQVERGRLPVALTELTPKFLSAELMDPWSGKPFYYRLNADGTFTLYSVGEDGRDDGGDPASIAATNSPPTMWTGKDALWPKPYFPDGAVNK